MARFQQLVGRFIRSGLSFAAAAKKASRASRSPQTARKSAGLLRSKGVVGRMARRRKTSGRFGRRARRAGRSGRRGGGLLGGFGGIENFAMNAGMGYAVGVGAKALGEKYAQKFMPGATPLMKYLGAYIAWKSGKGASGIAAALPIVMNGSMNGNGTSSPSNGTIFT